MKRPRRTQAGFVALTVACGLAALAAPQAGAAGSYDRSMSIQNSAEATLSRLARHALADAEPVRAQRASAERSAIPGCLGQPATLGGTPGNDTLAGTTGADVINGLGGDDVIRGFGSRDLLCGAAGEDIIIGDDGNDELSGGVGDVEALLGARGDDRILGGPGIADVASYLTASAGIDADLTAGTAVNTAPAGDGNDTLAGVESLQGSAHNDVLTGNAKLNFLSGVAGDDGDDRLDGLGGFDLATFFDADLPLDVQLAVDCDGQASATVGCAKGQGTDELTRIEGIAGGPLNDAIGGDSRSNVFFGGDGNDELVGSGQSDSLNGEAGDDLVGGSNGDDVVSGDAGDDDLDGGPGSDTASYASAPNSIQADLDLGNASGDGADQFFGVEKLTGSGFADDLRGDDEANALSGAAGNDSLRGFAGDDALYGGAGGDRIWRHAGGDSLFGDEGVNTLDGGGGIDQCFNPEVAPGCETGTGGRPTSISSGAGPAPPGAGAATRSAAAAWTVSLSVAWTSSVDCTRRPTGRCWPSVLHAAGRELRL